MHLASKSRFGQITRKRAKIDAPVNIRSKNHVSVKLPLNRSRCPVCDYSEDIQLRKWGTRCAYHYLAWRSSPWKWRLSWFTKNQPNCQIFDYTGCIQSFNLWVQCSGHYFSSKITFPSHYPKLFLTHNFWLKDLYTVGDVLNSMRVSLFGLKILSW